MKVGKETRTVEVVTYADEDVYVLEVSREELEIIAHALLVIGDKSEVKEVTGVDLDDLIRPLTSMINMQWRHKRRPDKEMSSTLGLV